jgi:hypothetical protein
MPEEMSCAIVHAPADGSLSNRTIERFTTGGPVGFNTACTSATTVLTQNDDKEPSTLVDLCVKTAHLVVVGSSPVPLLSRSSQGNVLSLSEL